MLNLLAFALLQFASFSSSIANEMPVKPATAPICVSTNINQAGDIAALGGTGGWAGDMAALGGTGGWAGDIAAA